MTDRRDNLFKLALVAKVKQLDLEKIVFELDQAIYKAANNGEFSYQTETYALSQEQVWVILGCVKYDKLDCEPKGFDFSKNKISMGSFKINWK